MKATESSGDRLDARTKGRKGGRSSRALIDFIVAKTNPRHVELAGRSD